MKEKRAAKQEKQVAQNRYARLGGEVGLYKSKGRLSSRELLFSACRGRMREPGSQTFPSERTRGQFIAERRYCGREIGLYSDANGARHGRSSERQGIPLVKVSWRDLGARSKHYCEADGAALAHQPQVDSTRAPRVVSDWRSDP